MKASKVQDDVANEINVPDIQGKTIIEASEILKDLGLELVINNKTEDLNMKENVVSKQIPLPGITVNQGTNIYIDY